MCPVPREDGGLGGRHLHTMRPCLAGALESKGLHREKRVSQQKWAGPCRQVSGLPGKDSLSSFRTWFTRTLGCLYWPVVLCWASFHSWQEGAETLSWTPLLAGIQPLFQGLPQDP